jgi:hypothetical protein
VTAVLGAASLHRVAGAAGNGTTDDTTAIQNALTAAAAIVATQGRQTVILPTGTYAVSFNGTAGAPSGYSNNQTPALLLKAGVELVADGQVTIKPAAIGATTLNGGITLPQATVTVASTSSFPSTGRIQFAGTTDVVTYTGKTSTTFTGCSGGTAVLSNGVAVAEGARKCVFGTDWSSQVSNWAVRGIKIDGQMTQAVEVEHGAFFIGPSTDWVIEDCEITGTLGKAIHVVGETSGAARVPARWTVRNNYIHDIASNAVGFSQAGATDFQITGNTIATNLLGGAESVICGSQTNVLRYVISNNIVTAFGDIGANGSDGLISGNTVVIPSTSLGPGIRVQNGSRLRIVGNSINMTGTTDTDCSGIRLTDTATVDSLIAGNSIVRAAGSGIAVSTSSGAHTGVVISGNTVSGGSGVEAGIVINGVSGATGATISSNVIRSTVQAINVKSGATDCTVSGNYCSGSEIIVSGAGATVTGNRVTGASGNNSAMRVLGGKSTCSGNVLTGFANNGSAGVLQLGSTFNAVVGNVLDNATANQKGVVENAGADNNKITSNILAGTSMANTIVGAGTVVA